MLEESFRIRISSRGNKVSLAGDETAVSLGIKSLNALYRRLEKGLLVNSAEVDATFAGPELGPADCGEPVGPLADCGGPPGPGIGFGGPDGP